MSLIEKPQTLVLNLPPDQSINKIVITVAKPGASSIKPTVIFTNEYEEHPLFHDLYISILRITNSMSLNGWDPGLTGDHSDMDDPLEYFTQKIKKIDKEIGKQEALQMMDAAITKVGNSATFMNIPDHSTKLEQLSRTLHTHFTQTFDTAQNNSVH